MKKILLFSLIMVSAFGCGDITELNIDTKSASNVPSYTLMSNAQKNMAVAMADASVNTNIFRMLVQHWAQTTYIDESNYDLNTRNIPQNFWNSMYRDVLTDFKEAKRLQASSAELADIKANQVAIIEIMEVYAYYTLVTTFGDIPYSKALDFNITQPSYDDDAVVLKDLGQKLQAALAKLKPTAGLGEFASADLFFHGDANTWKTFGYSLMMKIGMVMVDMDAGTAKSLVEAAGTNVISSNAQNCVFNFLSSPPNTHPVWTNLVQSGRNDYVMANTLVDKMKANNDPRLKFYGTKGSGGTYEGGIYGSNNNYATYSKISPTITAPNFGFVFADYAEMEFLKAEAVERGFNIGGGTAADHYNKAVTASVMQWGGTDAEASAYLAQPSVAYSSSANYKQKIGTQKWIALYERGFDAWVEWRRLDFPVLVAPSGAKSGVPLRFTYPSAEQTLNTANWTAASSAIGGDNVAIKLVWDKN